MNKAVLSAFTVFVLLLATEGHYIPSNYHWQQPVHYPTMHQMPHYPVNHGFMGHPAGNNVRPAFPGSGFNTGRNSRPAFPAPGSITGEREDQLLDILSAGLLFRSGASTEGTLSLLRAF